MPWQRTTTALAPGAKVLTTFKRSRSGSRQRGRYRGKQGAAVHLQKRQQMPQGLTEIKSGDACGVILLQGWMGDQDFRVS
jgi:hypothetical protein